MKLEIQSLEIADVKLIRGAAFVDRRGEFAETYVRRDFVAAGIAADFVQDNQSRSRASGTVRGLHFQVRPFVQAKLVRVLRGRIFDVAVDLRRNSPHYGRYVAAELAAGSGEQLLVPAGFAHGFCTLEPDTEVFYKVDATYSAAHDRGVNWLDPGLAIRWPIQANEAVLSEKDAALPCIGEPPVYVE